jgi:DNA mismatch endonuclease, patch repair protein
VGDTIDAARRSWNMSRIRGKNTKPELVVGSILRRNGFRFRKHVKGTPGKPDMVLKSLDAAVFVHGCYWHRHEECKHTTSPKTRPDFWENKFAANVERDQRKARELRELGYDVYIVWECDVPGKRSKTQGPSLKKTLNALRAKRRRRCSN